MRVSINQPIGRPAVILSPKPVGSAVHAHVVQRGASRDSALPPRARRAHSASYAHHLSLPYVTWRNTSKHMHSSNPSNARGTARRARTLLSSLSSPRPWSPWSPTRGVRTYVGGAQVDRHGHHPTDRVAHSCTPYYAWSPIISVSKVSHACAIIREQKDALNGGENGHGNS